MKTETGIEAGHNGNRPTIAAIAAEVGVSVPTVSKVLNGRSDVAAATRARIEKVLHERGYQRQSAASAAAPLVELVFHELDLAWSLEIVKAVQRTAAKAGLAVVLSELGGEHHPGRTWIDQVLARRPLGVILVQSMLTPAQRRQLDLRNVPYVVVDTDGEPPADVPAIGSNNWHGGLLATRHLLSLGHTRIGMISGREDVMCARARVGGYRAAHDEAGVDVMADGLRWSDFSVEGGYENGRELLSQKDRPTAIFAGSDMQALGVMRAARELGISIPEQLSVVGYDDVELAAWVGPPLTTIDQPLAEMAEMATKIVIDIANGVEPPLRRVELATELVVRDSTAPPA
ncbi:MAG: LacI family DNA-binding transcriptional regulator [Mycetocola sp.]